jgi:hypothetical protein
MRTIATLRSRAISALTATVIGFSFGVGPGMAAESDASQSPRALQLAQNDCRMFGPYATMRRANEVANEARSYGFSAVAFHNGDGYYVRVC